MHARVAAALCFSLLLLAPATLAQEYDEDYYSNERVTIQVDEFWQESVEVSEGLGAFDLTITVRVAAGPNINVAFLDEDNFNRYQRDELYAGYQGARDFDVGIFTASVSIRESGFFFLVIDNWDYDLQQPAAGPTAVEYTIEGGTNVAAGLPSPELWIVLGVLGLAGRFRRR